jgi:PKD repeat protein
MKKIYTILAIAATLLFVGCEYEPQSSFYSDSSSAAVNERIYFTNTSHNADYYEWDFGDGTFSDSYNTSHTYAQPGTYRVTLFAFRDDLVSTSSITINVYSDVSVMFEPETSISDIGYFIRFNNQSINANQFEWDFGDGYFSSATNPEHAYDEYGIYRVTLKAYSNGVFVGSYSQNIEINPTSLEIEVVEFYDEYVVADASIILYPTHSDWVNETNPLGEAFTNLNGKATFNYLTDRSYYVDVWEPNHNNYLLADEDINFIRTLPLLPGYKNTFVAWVDFVPSGNKAEAKAKAAEQKKLKIVKIERKYDEKMKEYNAKKDE